MFAKRIEVESAPCPDCETLHAELDRLRRQLQQSDADRLSDRIRHREKLRRLRAAKVAGLEAWVAAIESLRSRLAEEVEVAGQDSLEAVDLLATRTALRLLDRHGQEVENFVQGLLLQGLKATACILDATHPGNVLSPILRAGSVREVDGL